MNKLFELFKQAFEKAGSGSLSEIFWVITGQLLSVSLGFVIVKILSSLGTEQYGIYVLVLTGAALTGMLFYGPLQQGFLRFYYTYSNQNRQTYFSEYILSVLQKLNISILIIGILLFALNAWFSFFNLFFFFLAASVFVISFKFNEFFNSVLNLLRKRKLNSILQGAEKIISIALLLLLLYFQILSIQSALIILTASALIFGAGKYIYFKKQLPIQPVEDNQNFKPEIRKNLFVYILPFILWGISGWLQLNGEKWIINEFLSTSDVGIYGVMMTVVNTLVVIPNNIIVEFAMPIIFGKYADPDNSKNMAEGYNCIKIIFVLVLLLAAAASLAALWGGRFLITFISSESYTVYVDVLPLLTLGTGLFFTGQALTSLGLALNKPQKYLAPKIGIGILSVVLNIILIRYLGITGVAYSILISGLFYLVYIWFVNKNILNSIKNAG